MTDSMKVLIVGAGPAGLSLAMHLKHLGVKPTIIDKAKQHDQNSGGVFLQGQSLISLGYSMSERLSKQGNAITAGTIRSKSKELFSFDLTDLPGQFFAPMTISQFKIEQELIAELSKLGVEIQWGNELRELTQDEQGCEVSIKAKDVETSKFDYVVGADGFDSFVREAAGFGIVEPSNPGEWIVANINLRSSGLESSKVQMSIHEGRLTALFPLDPQGNFRIVRNSLSGDHTKPEYWADALAEFGVFELPEVHWSNRYTVFEKYSPQLRTGRVFLVGDAAHAHTPIGGQGMNLGLLESANLAWKLSMVAQGADDDLLDTYSEERSKVAISSFAKSSIVFKLIVTKSGLLKKLRDIFISSSKALSPVRDYLGASLRGEDEVYPAGGINREFFDSVQVSDYRELPEDQDIDNFFKGMKAGSQFSVYNEKLNSLVDDNAFTALLFDGREKTDDGRARVLAAYEFLNSQPLMRAYVLSEEDEPYKHLDNFILDPNMHLHNQLHASMESVYIIRPDMHIGFRSAPIDIPAIEAWWDDLLSGETE